MPNPTIQCSLRWLHQLEDLLLALVLFIMLALAITDIAMRLITGGSLIWIPPVLQILVLWLGLLGALLASRSQEHIAIDVISRFVGPLGKKVCGISGSVFAALICAIVAYSSIQFIQQAIEYDDIAFAQVPAWPLQLIIPFTFSLMSVRFFLHTLGFILIKNYQPNPALASDSTMSNSDMRGENS
jgi:TRAP-type C4-dicarboxylate transport system permease small subunit